MRFITAVVAIFVSGTLASAAGPQAQQPQPQAQTTTPRRPAAPRPVAVKAYVRDVSGSPLSGVKIVVGASAASDATTVTTDDKGTAVLGTLKDGTYRLRFERDGFVTLEREVTIRSGQPNEVYAAMRVFSVPPAAAAPPPPAPAPPPPSPPAASAPSGPPVFVSIPDFLDKNFLGREPLKESVLGCLPTSTTRLLQLHDAIAEHTHPETDEILYVVAGEGTIRLRSDSSAIAPGSLSIIPRGVPHAVDRRGKNPLIVISILSGTPCSEQPAQASTTKR